MKLTKMLKKAGRTALILAMVVSLCGTTLCKAFASYGPPGYVVNVEHVFHDYKNGAEVETGEYSPRDDLIDGLDKKAAGGKPGALNVEYGPSTESPEGNISLNGTETGENIGWDDASKAAVKEWLKNKLDDNKDGNEALKNTLENIYKEYAEAVDGEPWGHRPEGDEPTSIPEEIPELPTAEVEDPGEAPKEPERQREDESKEDYELRLAEHDKKFEAWKDARDAYDADQARLADERAAYDEAMKPYEDAYNEWVAGLEDPEDAEDIGSWLKSWKDWEEYQQRHQKWENSYLDTLQKVLEELRSLVGEDDLDTAVEITDKNLLSGYEKARLEVVMDCLGYGYDDEEDDWNWDAVIGKLDAGSGSYESSGIKIDTWKGEGEYNEGERNLFEFKAWLDKSSKTALAGGDYTTGNDGNPTRITVICVKYDRTEKEGTDGKIYTIWTEDSNAGTKIYISEDNGVTWYEADEDGNKGTDEVDTASILGNGWVTGAVTFTFEHYWKPPTPDTPVVELPEDPVPEESEKPEDPEPEVSETPDEPEPEVSETPEEPVEDPAIPLGEPPEKTEVDEPDVPLSDIPQTGDISVLWYAAALVAAVGLMGLLYQDRREKKND